MFGREEDTKRERERSNGCATTREGRGENRDRRTLIMRMAVVSSGGIEALIVAIVVRLIVLSNRGIANGIYATLHRRRHTL